jgi:hypothetical protein
MELSNNEKLVVFIPLSSLKTAFKPKTMVHSSRPAGPPSRGHRSDPKKRKGRKTKVNVGPTDVVQLRTYCDQLTFAHNGAKKVILTECRQCNVDWDKKGRKYIVDHSKPFTSACIGFLDPDGCVIEDGCYLVSTNDLTQTLGPPLIFTQASTGHV